MTCRMWVIKIILYIVCLEHTFLQYIDYYCGCSIMKEVAFVAKLLIMLNIVHTMKLENRYINLRGGNL